MSNCKVIALTNQKGGVGKTTMALGYNRPDDISKTLSTVMQDIVEDKSIDVSHGILHHSEGVDLLPSNIELSGFEVRLINAMSRERVLKT